MKGRILRYSVDGTGAISGDDGQRYQFVASDWKLPDYPTQGMYVDFDVDDGRAFDFVLLTVAGQKSKIVAGILALLLGTLGIHKFYLGYVVVGVVYLLVSITFIGLFLTVPVSIIDGIIYLTKSDEDFDKTYVQNRKSWF